MLPSLKVNPHRASAATLALWLALLASIAASIEVHCDAPKSVPDPFASVTLYTMDPIWCSRWRLTLDVFTPYDYVPFVLKTSVYLNIYSYIHLHPYLDFSSKNNLIQCYVDLYISNFDSNEQYD